MCAQLLCPQTDDTRGKTLLTVENFAIDFVNDLHAFLAHVEDAFLIHSFAALVLIFKNQISLVAFVQTSTQIRLGMKQIQERPRSKGKLLWHKFLL